MRLCSPSATSPHRQHRTTTSTPSHSCQFPGLGVTPVATPNSDRRHHLHRRIRCSLNHDSRNLSSMPRHPQLHLLPIQSSPAPRRRLPQALRRPRQPLHPADPRHQHRHHHHHHPMRRCLAQPRVHLMVTRACAGIHKPNPKYAITPTEVISPIPRSVRSAFKDPHSYGAMKKEYDALLANKTWTLVPRPPGARIITGKWVFKHKLNPDGTLERYKAPSVVRGFNQ